MKGTWQRSKVITGKSWGILKENRYLLLFPVVGAAIGLLLLALLWGGAMVAFTVDSPVLGSALVIIGALAISLTTTLCSAGLVASVDEELNGRASSFGFGMGRALSRLLPLLAWSVISTIVSLLIGLVRGDGNSGGVAVLLRGVLSAAAGVLWGVITFFTLPLIMLERAGAIDAIRRSSALARQRWGLQIAGGARIGGFIALILVLPGLALLILGVVVVVVTNASAVGVSGGGLLVAVGIFLIVIGTVITSAMRGVFSVALYHYANDEQALGGFTAPELQAAVATEPAKGSTGE